MSNSTENIFIETRDALIKSQDTINRILGQTVVDVNRIRSVIISSSDSKANILFSVPVNKFVEISAIVVQLMENKTSDLELLNSIFGVTIIEVYAFGERSEFIKHASHIFAPFIPTSRSATRFKDSYKTSKSVDYYNYDPRFQETPTRDRYNLEDIYASVNSAIKAINNPPNVLFVNVKL